LLASRRVSKPIFQRLNAFMALICHD